MTKTLWRAPATVMVVALLFSATAARAEWPGPTPAAQDDLQSFARWQKALEHDDRAWIVKHSAPPIDVVSCENDAIGDRAFGDRLAHTDWSADYDHVITDHVKKAIAEATRDDLFPRDIIGMVLYRPGIALWFAPALNRSVDGEKFELESVWDWGRDTCNTVVLDPRRKDYKAIPVGLQGEWGIKGKCARVKDRLTLTATTSQMGKEKPRPIFFDIHDGPVGAFQALEWEEDGETGHFNLDIMKMNWLQLVSGWSSSPSYGDYQRCKSPPKKPQ